MKRISSVLAALALAGTLYAAESDHEGWTTDLPKAKSQAKAEKKMVLIDFAGSDWCPPCKALYKNVLSSEEFKAYAKTNLVLVDIDFPRQKEQSEELKRANQKLSTEFGIKGLPTVVVLSSDGKQLKKDTGYSGQSASAYIAELEKLRKQNK